MFSSCFCCCYCCDYSCENREMSRRNTIAVIIFLCFIKFGLLLASNYNFIDLPDTHLPYYFATFTNVAEKCRNDGVNCPYAKWLNENVIDPMKCWGYEPECKAENAFSRPKCSGESPAWMPSKDDQVKTFFTQADFGYVRQQIDELMVLCTPLFPNDSILECSKYLRYCRGRNIMMNFTEMSTRPARYKMDVLSHGQVGGYCDFNQKMLGVECDHMSALQSWAPELRNFVQLNERPIDANRCDVVYEKPTFIMKIDASNNMYHHFCDFFNLYASLHVNMTNPMAFSTDNNIIIWETYNYESPFAAVFKAFTKNPVVTIRQLNGKTVCFKNLVLPLLPRMIFGLYYNTPIMNGCERSGLFQAFSEHVLHRLNIPLHKKRNGKIRITFLARKTKYRRILNEAELLAELRKNDSYIVRSVNYERSMSFTDQLEVTRNTDIFIGMHGAGLTHLMFLPNWATIFELFNCEDPACYFDLARIRGVNYITWENRDKLTQQDEGHHPDGGAHAKFTNYSFDQHEFIRLVNKGADNVLNHPEFHNYIVKHFDHSEL